MPDFFDELNKMHQKKYRPETYQEFIKRLEKDSAYIKEVAKQLEQDCQELDRNQRIKNDPSRSQR